MKRIVLFAAVCIAAILSTASTPTVSDSQLVRTRSPKITRELAPRIQCGNALGTGVILGNNSLITAHHVIEGEQSCVIVEEPSMARFFSPIKLSQPLSYVGDDFSILWMSTMRGHNKSFKINCDSMVAGEQYWIAGYPPGATNLFISSGIALNGYVNTRAGDKGTKLGYHKRMVRAEVYHGMSGGPVVNSSGEVIAILSAIATQGEPVALVKELRDTKLCAAPDK